MTSAPTVFERAFGSSPEASGSAPGRVNLMGDHTDYNGGFVLPTTIPQRTVVELGVADDEDEVYSATLGERLRFQRQASLTGFSRYVAGCFQVLEAAGHAVPPVRVAIASEVPVGVGLSSSAALEVATLRALDGWRGLQLDPVVLAQYAQRAERDYAGVNCGIMDQMACSIGAPGRMLFLDTRTLDYKLVALPARSELVVVDSGIARQLAASAYNLRHAECQAAAKMLGLRELRDFSGDPSALAPLPHPLQERSRHVISENARVLAALTADAVEFGALMNASHWSLARDYEVSIPAVDELVVYLQRQPEVYGARMTGAGFGGACVALVKEGQGRTLATRLRA